MFRAFALVLLTSCAYGVRTPDTGDASESAADAATDHAENGREDACPCYQDPFCSSTPTGQQPYVPKNRANE